MNREAKVGNGCFECRFWGFCYIWRRVVRKGGVGLFVYFVFQ